MALHMIRLLTGFTAPLATMCQCHATAVAMCEIRRSIGVSAYDAKRTTTG